MSKKLKTISISVVLLIIICGIIPLLWMYSSTKPYTKVINKNWNIGLPNDGAKDIFSYSEPSPHGDGIRYHVIDYPVGNESKKIQNSVFQLGKIFHGTKPTDDQISYVEELLEEINIKDDVIPDWERCRLVYQKQDDNSEIFLFYETGDGTLYVVESFL